MLELRGSGGILTQEISKLHNSKTASDSFQDYVKYAPTLIPSYIHCIYMGEPKNMRYAKYMSCFPHT